MDPLKVGDPIRCGGSTRRCSPARVVSSSEGVFSYEIVRPTECAGATAVDHVNGEGHWWVRGTEGEAVNALRNRRDDEVGVKLRAGVRISVVENWNRERSAARVVKRARIVKVARTRFMWLIHYRLVYDDERELRGTQNDGVLDRGDKGKTWVVGWEGPQVRALATVAALDGGE